MVPIRDKLLNHKSDVIFHQLTQQEDRFFMFSWLFYRWTYHKGVVPSVQFQFRLLLLTFFRRIEEGSEQRCLKTNFTVHDKILSNVKVGSFSEEWSRNILHFLDGQSGVDGPIDEDPSQVLSFDLLVVKMFISSLGVFVFGGGGKLGRKSSVDSSVSNTFVHD